MTIYLAGPITGDKNYRKKFKAAADWLKGMGFEVNNPAELPDGWTPKEYMAACIPMLLGSDCATFLPGWLESSGASIERRLADYCGIPVLEWDNVEVFHGDD